SPTRAVAAAAVAVPPPARAARVRAGAFHGIAYSRGAMSLAAKAVGVASADDVLSRFVARVAETGLSLYPAQEEAILEMCSGKHVILNTPTGSGKSLVATALHFKALSENKISY